MYGVRGVKNDFLATSKHCAKLVLLTFILKCLSKSDLIHKQLSQNEMEFIIYLFEFICGRDICIEKVNMSIDKNK